MPICSKAFYDELYDYIIFDDKDRQKYSSELVRIYSLFMNTFAYRFLRITLPYRRNIEQKR